VIGKEFRKKIGHYLTRLGVEYWGLYFFGPPCIFGNVLGNGAFSL